MQKRKSTSLKFTERSQTDQSYKASCEINNMVDQRTGQLKAGARLNSRFDPRNPRPMLDASEVPQLQEALNAGIAEGELMFSLNPQLQRLANNDPRQVEKVLADPENRELLIKAGIFNKPEPAPAAPAPVPAPAPAVPAPAGPAPAQP